MPETIVLLEVVKGEVVEEEHLLVGVCRHEPSQEVAVVCCIQIVRLHQQVTSCRLDLETVLASEGKLGFTDVAVGVEELTLTRAANLAVLGHQPFDLGAGGHRLAQVEVFDVLSLLREDEVVVDRGLEDVLVNLLARLFLSEGVEREGLGLVGVHVEEDVAFSAAGAREFANGSAAHELRLKLLEIDVVDRNYVLSVSDADFGRENELSFGENKLERLENAGELGGKVADVLDAELAHLQVLLVDGHEVAADEATSDALVHYEHFD